jgi:hypothetical protein
MEFVKKLFLGDFWATVDERAVLVVAFWGAQRFSETAFSLALCFREMDYGNREPGGYTSLGGW